MTSSRRHQPSSFEALTREHAVTRAVCRRMDEMLNALAVARGTQVPLSSLCGPSCSKNPWIHHVDTLVPPGSFVFQRVPQCSALGAILWIIVVEWNIEKHRRTPGNPSNKLQNSYREFDSHTRLQFHPLQLQRVVRVVVFGELLRKGCLIPGPFTETTTNRCDEKRTERTVALGSEGIVKFPRHEPAPHHWRYF